MTSVQIDCAWCAEHRTRPWAAGDLVVFVHPLAAARIAGLLDAGSATDVEAAAVIDADLGAATEHVASLLGRDVRGPLLVGAANLRPAAAGIARVIARPAPAEGSGSEDECVATCRIDLVCIGAGGAPSVDSVYIAGRLIRLLFEESDCALALTDAAGMALTVASGHSHRVGDTFSTSARARALGDERVGELMLAAQLDDVGSVPELVAGVWQALA